MDIDSAETDILLFAIQCFGAPSGEPVDVRTPLIKAAKSAVADAKARGLVIERKQKRPAFTATGEPKLTKSGKRSQETVTLLDLTEEGQAHLASRVQSLANAAALSGVAVATRDAMESFFAKERERIIEVVRQEVAEKLQSNPPGELSPANREFQAKELRNDDLGTHLYRAWDVLRHYPDSAGTYVELPKLYHEVQKHEDGISVMEFHDCLRDLERQQKITFANANSASNVKEPDLGFRDHDQLVYYVKFREEGES